MCIYKIHKHAVYLEVKAIKGLPLLYRTGSVCMGSVVFTIALAPAGATGGATGGAAETLGAK